MAACIATHAHVLIMLPVSCAPHVAQNVLHMIKAYGGWTFAFQVRAVPRGRLVANPSVGATQLCHADACTALAPVPCRTTMTRTSPSTSTSSVRTRQQSHALRKPSRPGSRTSHPFSFLLTAPLGMVVRVNALCCACSRVPAHRGHRRPAQVQGEPHHAQARA